MDFIFFEFLHFPTSAATAAGIVSVIQAWTPTLKFLRFDIYNIWNNRIQNAAISAHTEIGQLERRNLVLKNYNSAFQLYV